MRVLWLLMLLLIPTRGVFAGPMVFHGQLTLPSLVTLPPPWCPNGPTQIAARIFDGEPNTPFNDPLYALSWATPVPGDPQPAQVGGAESAFDETAMCRLALYALLCRGDWKPCSLVAGGCTACTFSGH